MIKIWTTIFFIGLRTVDSFGQDSPCDSVYTIVDQMPTYGKGTEDLMRYLMKNLKFKKPCRPEELRRLTWTIDKEGKMIDIDLIGLEGKCRDEIIEQLKSFPAWTPGRLNGKLVSGGAIGIVSRKWRGPETETRQDDSWQRTT
jgi:hypothetical protein